MNSRILAADLPAHVGQRVTIAGWLHRRRELKSVTFLIVRDRSGLAQVVLPSSASPDPASPDPASPDPAGPGRGRAEQVIAPPEETVIAVEGMVTANPQAPGGAEMTERCSPRCPGRPKPPPFDLYRPAITAALPAILDHAPTTLRHPRLRAGFEIAAASVAGFREALDELGFTEVHTPKIVGSATESGANDLRDRLFRPARLPGPVPAVLQASPGGSVRAGLRGRPGVPGRAA